MSFAGACSIRGWFLDVGCGRGALVMHAAESYGVQASGCTVSRNQYRFATSATAARALQNRGRVLDNDYRDTMVRFHKIASIGMFEHVAVAASIAISKSSTVCSNRAACFCAENAGFEVLWMESHRRPAL